jgi:hypothetical protein
VKAAAREAEKNQAHNTGKQRKICGSQPTVQVISSRCRSECPDLQKTKESKKEDEFSDVNEVSVNVSVVRAVD